MILARRAGAGRGCSPNTGRSIGTGDVVRESVESPGRGAAAILVIIGIIELEALAASAEIDGIADRTSRGIRSGSGGILGFGDHEPSGRGDGDGSGVLDRQGSRFSAGGICNRGNARGQGVVNPHQHPNLAALIIGRVAQSPSNGRTGRGPLRAQGNQCCVRGNGVPNIKIRRVHEIIINTEKNEIPRFGG